MEKVNILDPRALVLAGSALEAGGVVMHPTETCYGLAVDIFNQEALEKLYRIKGRDAKKPISILVDSFGMAQEFGLFSEKALELAQRYWPGPLSIVVPRKKSLPEFLNPEEDFVSIRFSADAFSTDMVEELGRPVTTTSANLSGQEPLYIADVSSFGALKSEVALLVDGGEISKNSPSTVVKVDGDMIEVLRQGDILIN